MPELFDFFDPTPEEQNIVLVNAATLREAEKLIDSCEQCNPEGAEIPFDNILDRVTGSDPSVTDYILEQQSARIAAARFWKKLSLSLPDVAHVMPGYTSGKCRFRKSA